MDKVNNEILELADGIKIMADVLINDGQSHKEIELKSLIKLCEYIERVNNLKPVGYMESNGIEYIKQYGFTHINAEQSGSINIPLYKLD